MKFLRLFDREVEFGNIEGYDDIKDLVRRALGSNENYNLLLCGPPASAKTSVPTWNIAMQKGCLFQWLKHH